MAELLTYDVWDLINIQNMDLLSPKMVEKMDEKMDEKMEEKKEGGGRRRRKMVRRELTMEEYVGVILVGGAKLPNMKKNFMLEKEEMVKLRGAFTMGRLRRMTKKKE